MTNVLLSIAITATFIVSAAPDPVAERRALERASALADLKNGVRVVLIDPELAPDPDAIAGLDAFVVRNPNGGLRNVIYINRRSTIVQRAAAGSELHVLVLAAVVHHEARHLAGAGEPEARRAEAEFFSALLARYPGQREAGDRYLHALDAAAKSVDTVR
jgi:hypothetical protein